MSKTFVLRVQQRLNQYGAGIKEDGEPGPATNAALDTYLPPKASGPVDPAAFFAGVRAAFGPLSQSQVDGFNAILLALKGWDRTWIAYALATSWHETGYTMQPIKEYGGPAYFKKMYDIEGARPDKARELGNFTPGDGAKYAGRGYPQVTGRRNYELAEKVFGIPFSTDPDLMMVADNAAKVMRHFMEKGLFTGKKLADYLPGDYVGARRIINGTDKAEAIARHAEAFEAALIAGGWR